MAAMGRDTSWQNILIDWLAGRADTDLCIRGVAADRSKLEQW